MTELNQIYKCEICGNIIEVLHKGVGGLVCCGHPMKLFEAKTSDEGQEKHVPVIEKNECCINVKVGSIPHPMAEKHYIEWIELIADGLVYKKFLKSGESPEAEFCVKAEQVTARAYCNIHDLWRSK